MKSEAIPSAQWSRDMEPELSHYKCHESSTGVVYNLEFKMKKKKEYVQRTPEKEARRLAICLRPATRDKHQFCHTSL